MLNISFFELEFPLLFAPATLSSKRKSSLSLIESGKKSFVNPSGLSQQTLPVVKNGLRWVFVA